MLTALRQKVTVRRGGWISVRSRDLKPGATAEVIVLVEPAVEQTSLTVSPQGQTAPAAKTMTAADLLNSGLVGLWERRSDIGDSAEFARRLRQQAEHREEDADDPD